MKTVYIVSKATRAGDEKTLVDVSVSGVCGNLSTAVKMADKIIKEHHMIGFKKVDNTEHYVNWNNFDKGGNDFVGIQEWTVF